MTSTTTSKNVRLTISVTPEVHEAFKRIAEATSGSISRAMGDWLSDTLESAQFMANKVEQARSAPKAAMAELHAYAVGLSDETGLLLSRIGRAGGTATAPERSPAAGAVPPAGAIPPSSNTGGKGPKPTAPNDPQSGPLKRRRA